MLFQQFYPREYSAENCKKLISLGFNPKLPLYYYDLASSEAWAELWTESLGPAFTSLPDTVWYSLRDLTCNENCPADCPDKKGKFKKGNGLRVEKDLQLGSGGFGSVYQYKLHGQKIAAKFIDVSVFGSKIYVQVPVHKDNFSQNAVSSSKKNLECPYKIPKKGMSSVGFEPWTSRLEDKGLTISAISGL